MLERLHENLLINIGNIENLHIITSIKEWEQNEEEHELVSHKCNIRTW